MTEIIFYTDVDSGLGLISKLAIKIMVAKRRACVVTPDTEMTNAVGKYLWTYSDTAFIPSQKKSMGDIGKATPITIMNSNDVPHNDILINLTLEIPSQFSSFSRLIEIVCKETTSIEKARDRYKWYKNRGYPITTHKMSKVT